MTTIYDIAKYCHLAPSTVSKVLNGYENIKPETKQKVKQAIKDLNYIPNIGAINLSKAKYRNVGILSYYETNITPFNHELFADISNHFYSKMNDAKYDILFVCRNVLGKEKTFYQNCKSRNISGVVLFGNMSKPEMQEMMDKDVPCVAFDYLGEKNIDSVTSNNKEMMETLTNYCLNKGHRRIAYISGAKSDVSQVRFQGFLDALKQHEIVWDENNFYESKYHDDEKARSIVQKIINKKEVSLIMCPDDFTAAVAIQVIKEMGFRCPEDISVTGFDGVDVSRYTSPKLTTIKQNTFEIANALGDLLIKRMQDNEAKVQRVVIKGILVEGESVQELSKVKI